MQPHRTFTDLKAQQRAERDEWPPSVALRTHRALSWLQRAEQEQGDPDAAFICLWISFNAAYGRVIESDEQRQEKNSTERDKYEEFIKKLLTCDRTHRIEGLLFDQFSSSIEQLIANEYVYYEYWNHWLNPASERDWRKSMNTEVNNASSFVKKRSALPYLMIVLSRLNVLRNQIMHGASTWNSTTNRSQVQDAAAFMRQFVPLMIELMMNDPDQEWGDPMYPVQY